MQLVLDNEDLLREILLRLPAKSLTRFKSVCKKWLSIISPDEFCHHHTLRRPKLQPSLILRLNYKEFFYFNPTTNGEKKMIPYDTSEFVPGSKIVQACNGLMLLELRNPDDNYFVYNPTTRRLRKIVLTRNDKYPRVVGINLAFDPSKSPYYKIVCIKSFIDISCMYYTYQIEVYDSESHTWKLGLEAFTSDTYLSSEGILWNNGIYWRAHGGGFCWFDIGTNEMKTLCYPYNPETDCTPHLQEYNGDLYCYVVESEAIVVWELRRNDDHCPQWLVKCNDFIGKCETAKEIVRFMGRSDGDELLYHADGKIWTYNFGDQTYNKNPLDLKTQPCDQPDKNGYFYVKGFHFGETLALV